MGIKGPFYESGSDCGGPVRPLCSPKDKKMFSDWVIGQGSPDLSEVTENLLTTS